MNLNYSKGKKENTTVAVGLAYRGTRPARLATTQPTWFVGPRLRAGELAPMAPVDGGVSDEVQWRGSGEQGGWVVDQFWGGREEEAHQKNELGEVWSAEGEQRWGATSGGGGQQLTVREGRTR
jgi:hypothetical protein